MSWIFAPAAFEALEIACETAEFGELDFFYQNVAKTLDELGFEIREKK